MPRRDVEFATGNYYHIYNRGSGRQTIFCEPENYVYLLRLLKRYSQELDVAVIAYCPLPNHYHLLVRQDDAVPAGRLPQRVFNSYTKAFNKRYDCSGTLFQGPFKATHVDKEEYIIHLCRYIHGNPVKAGIVPRLEEWPYSNFHQWVGSRAGTLFDPDFVGGYFASGAEYEGFVRDYVDDIDQSPDGLSAYVIE